VFHIWFNLAWIVQSAKRYFGNHWNNFLWDTSWGWVIVLLIEWIAVKGKSIFKFKQGI